MKVSRVQIVAFIGVLFILAGLPLRSSAVYVNSIHQTELIDIFTHRRPVWPDTNERLCVIGFSDFSPAQKIFSIDILGIPPNEFVQKKKKPSRVCSKIVRSYQEMDFQIEKTPYSVGYNLYGVLYNDSYQVQYVKVIY